MNLVGSTARDELVVHVLDSLAAADVLPHGARVVDLGSGAGFPGLPLAIERPDLSLTLVEIREARVHFLRHVVRQLGLGCAVRRGSIDEPPVEAYDYALLKAVAPVPEAARRGVQWVRDDGEVWIWSRVGAVESQIEGAVVHPIAGESDRGGILRLPARAIPRGTHPSGAHE